MQSEVTPESEAPPTADTALERKHQFLRQAGYGESKFRTSFGIHSMSFIALSGKFDTFHRADLRISDIGNLLGSDWVKVAKDLDIEESDINIIKSEYPDNQGKL